MEQRRVLYTAPYGGSIGLVIAALVLVAAVVLWLTNQMDPKLCAMFGSLALARLL
jgi:hypothetical protein